MQTILPVYDIEQFHYLGKTADIYVNTWQEHFKQHEFILKPHKHNFFFIFLCTKGTGTHRIDFMDYDVTPGSVFLICPGKAHSWTLSPDADGYIFFHTRSFFNLNASGVSLLDFPFYCSLYNDPFIMLEGRDRAITESLFHDILNEYRNDNLMKFQRIGALLDLLYIDFTRLYLPDSKRKVQNQNFLSSRRRFESLIDKHFKKIKSAGEYADLLHLSEKHLNRICKETINKTATEMIIERTMVEAKRILVFTKASVSQVSENVGYADMHYFSRLFKKKCGLTPLEFRKMYNSGAN
jgi:AraC family transcriptional activator of pobA